MCSKACCCEPKNFCCEKKECCGARDCCDRNDNHDNRRGNECCGRNDCECNPCCAPVMTDCLAREIECIWKQAFCDSILIPCIGVPSTARCVMTLTHTMGKCAPKIRLNGLESRSPLVNNAFYSAEVSGGKWLNLYQVMIPDIPGKCGCKSSGEIYTEALVKLGISIEGDHYNWKGSCPFMLAINSKAIGMSPCDFSKKQIAALRAVSDHFSKPCCGKPDCCCK
jgi:hypothetical protein